MVEACLRRYRRSFALLDASSSFLFLAVTFHLSPLPTSSHPPRTNYSSPAQTPSHSHPPLPLCTPPTRASSHGFSTRARRPLTYIAWSWRARPRGRMSGPVWLAYFENTGV
ncbi:hypothetical protein DFH09DRAFT_259307 [Mycena vulgaris]|nr:hypothetical protein DFH09DRAFT_259307 [Mycena vulgaris]